MKRYRMSYPSSDINEVSFWPYVPYAGECTLPIPEEPTAGSWYTFFFYRNKNGQFTNKNGEVINFKIRIPNNRIDFEGEQLYIVKQTLRNITPKQIKIAEYWGDGPATKQWTPIIDQLIDTYGVTAPRAGRILAAAQAAMNDCFVIAWYYKFKWEIARPNQLDRCLATVTCTPYHPSYPSGHATVAGCNEVVLSYFFPGESKRLKELAEECAVSRLYGGVHYPIDNDEGLRLGRDIGKRVVKQLKNQKTLCGNPIDIPYTKNLNAKLQPPPYTQAIPYPRDMHCPSKTIFNS